MKNLYLVRHGQTLFNKLGKVQGACDSPLTEEGISQALQARQYFIENKIEIDHYYSSTQERACDTMEFIAPDQSYQRLKGLKEMNFGVFEGEPSMLQPKGPENYETFYVQFGGESAKQVMSRMNETLLAIMRKENHQNVLAVSHNGASFYFLKSKWNPDNGNIPLQVPNCAIFIYNYTGSNFELEDIIDPANKRSIFK
jgi:broad specificity phosphatase PhoE